MTDLSLSSQPTWFVITFNPTAYPSCHFSTMSTTQLLELSSSTTDSNFHPSSRPWAPWKRTPCIITSVSLPPRTQGKFNKCWLIDRPWSTMKTNSYPELFLLLLSQIYLSRKTAIFITILQQPKVCFPTASSWISPSWFNKEEEPERIMS